MDTGCVNKSCIQKYLQIFESMLKTFPVHTPEEYIDGQVVIQLLNTGNDKASIKASICSLTPNSPSILLYAERIVAQCADVLRSYELIRLMPFSVKAKLMPLDIYRLYAFETLQKHPDRLLNSNDDKSIAIRMLAENILVDDVYNAIKLASPVSKEPGRNADKYVETIISISKTEHEKFVIPLDSKDAVTAYVNRMSVIQEFHKKENEELQKVENNRAFVDAKVAKELLEEQMQDDKVIYAITVQSPLASENAFNKTPADYAKFIVDAAKEGLAAEKAILGFVAKRFEDEQLSIEQVYQSLVKERIAMYPSTVNSLGESYIDRDIADRMLHLGYTVAEIIMAIRMASPRAKMPGIARNYPEKTVEAIVRINNDKSKHMCEIEGTCNEYIKQCGLAVEGIVGAEKEFTAYHDGRAAVKMLENGKDKIFVRNVIAENSPCNELKNQKINPYKYAEVIVDSAAKVIARSENIKTFIVPAGLLSISQEYEKRMNLAFKNLGYFTINTDIEVVAGMVKDGLSRDNIQKALTDYSPVMVEPGRGENYTEYVFERANVQIALEHEKVERYKPIPRENKMENPVDEYRYHVYSFEHMTGGKLSPEMDGRIAKAMLEQGYEKKDIGTTIAQYSACAPFLSNEAREYSRKVVRELEREIKSKNISKDFAVCPELSFIKAK